MRKLMIRLTVPIVFAFSIALMANTVRADEPPGAKLYATYCAACHGANGSGAMAAAIGTAKYLTANNDASIAQLIGSGVPTKGMPAWSKSKGGALTDDQITSIVAYLRSLVGASASAQNAPQSAQNGPLIRTKVALTQSDGADGETVINALLHESTGYPVRDAILVFTRATSWGIVEVGTAKTGAYGIAQLALLEVPEASRELTVSFKGDQRLDASSGKIILEPLAHVNAGSGSFDAGSVMLSLDEPLLPADGSLITPNPPLLPTLIIALLVGGIWATYAHVVYQLYGIWKGGRIAPRRNEQRMNRGRDYWTQR
jgi:mono/diheme cytochrome c family protein